MSLINQPLTEVENREASWIPKFDGGAAAKTGTGGVVLWEPNAHLVIAYALCFSSLYSMMNYMRFMPYCRV